MLFDTIDLATRRIRSAGRQSGSIVITLPAELAGLEGIDCALAISGGRKPVIQLQPDWEPVEAILAAKFLAMQAGLHDEGARITSAPLDKIRIVARSQRRFVADGLVALALEDLAALRPGPVQPRGDSLFRVVRALAALDALARGQSDSVAEDYGSAFAHHLTGERLGLDLFIIDLVAAVGRDLGPTEAGNGEGLDKASSWSPHADLACRLRDRLFGRAGRDDRDRRADFATALRFERLSA